MLCQRSRHPPPESGLLQLTHSTPLPTYTAAVAAWRLTVCTSFKAVGLPVDEPLTMTASARPRSTVSSTSSPKDLSPSAAECFTATSAQICVAAPSARRYLATSWD